jgi:hypothetical protein
MSSERLIFMATGTIKRQKRVVKVFHDFNDDVYHVRVFQGRMAKSLPELSYSNDDKADCVKAAQSLCGV